MAENKVPWEIADETTTQNIIAIREYQLVRRLYRNVFICLAILAAVGFFMLFIVSEMITSEAELLNERSRYIVSNFELFDNSARYEAETQRIRMEIRGPFIRGGLAAFFAISVIGLSIPFFFYFYFRKELFQKILEPLEICRGKIIGIERDHYKQRTDYSFQLSFSNDFQRWFSDTRVYKPDTCEVGDSLLLVRGDGPILLVAFREQSMQVYLHEATTRQDSSIVLSFIHGLLRKYPPKS